MVRLSRSDHKKIGKFFSEIADLKSCLICETFSEVSFARLFVSPLKFGLRPFAMQS